MPPWILPLIAAIVTAIPIIAVVVRVVVPWWSAKVSTSDLERIIGALKGAVVNAMPIVRMTPTDVDDKFVAQVLQAALDEFEREYERRPKVKMKTLVDVATAVSKLAAR